MARAIKAVFALTALRKRFKGVRICALICLVVESVGAAIPQEVDVVVAGGTVAGVKSALKAAATGKRVFVAAPRPYLGEDRAGTYLVEKTTADDPKDPLVRAMFDPRTRADAAWTMPEDTMGVSLSYQLAAAMDKPPMKPDMDGLLPVTTPLEVKRSLDKALLQAKIPFLTGVGVVDVERDAGGRLVSVTVNGRDGNRRRGETRRAAPQTRCPSRAKARHVDTSAVVLHDSHGECSNLWGVFDRVRRHVPRLRLHFACKGL